MSGESPPESPGAAEAERSPLGDGQAETTTLHWPPASPQRSDNEQPEDEVHSKGHDQPEDEAHTKDDNHRVDDETLTPTNAGAPAPPLHEAPIPDETRLDDEASVRDHTQDPEETPVHADHTPVPEAPGRDETPPQAQSPDTPPPIHASPAPIAASPAPIAVSPAPIAAFAAPPAPLVPEQAGDHIEAGFRERGQLRRRARYLRQMREIQLRDIGGFVLELHRFGRDRPDLVQAKVAGAAGIDRELRALERALGEHESLRELREAGVGGACEGCGAVHGSRDRFCSRCGASL
ncbi:MAG: hypothetical protein ACR2OB_03905 [Solirubrobacteraceae bacterium]